MCAYIQQVSDEMKTIKDMAHDYMCNLILKGFPLNEVDIMAERCFKLAEAMQAEAEKRKPTPNADHIRKVREAQWQPDWSQAPDWAKWWCQDEDGDSWWCEEKPIISTSFWNGFEGKAPSFNYQGDWKDSLRKRP